MARMRRRDRMKDDPVEDYNKTKSEMDEAIMSRESGKTATAGGAFPTVGGGLPTFTMKSPDIQAEAAPESYFGEMSITERMKPAVSSGQVFRVGSKGAEVGEIQQFLKAKGLYGGEIDNDFGPQTKEAVKKFQRAMGLVDDGVIGTNTLDALLPEMAKYVGPVRNEDMPAPSALPDGTFSDADIKAMDMDTRALMMRTGRISPERMGEAFNQLTPAPAAPKARATPRAYSNQSNISDADIRAMDESTLQLMMKHGVLRAEDIAAASLNS